jgi:hypothetical protein
MYATECCIVWFTVCLVYLVVFNLLNAKLNPIFHLPALLGAQTILHVSRVRVNTDLSSVLYSFLNLNSV